MVCLLYYLIVFNDLGNLIYERRIWFDTIQLCKMSVLEVLKRFVMFLSISVSL